MVPGDVKPGPPRAAIRAAETAVAAPVPVPVPVLEVQDVGWSFEN